MDHTNNNRTSIDAVRKAILLSAVLTLLLLLLCACFRQGPAESQAPEPTPAPSETPTPLPPATENVSLSPTKTPAETPAPKPTETQEPTEIPTPEPTEVPTPEPTETPVPIPTPFSIVWMSDTQNLSRDYPEVFFRMRDWILQEREALNIVYFVHTGDVVDACTEKMWANATEALMPILDTIPGMIASGNHDIGREEYQSFFYNRPYAKAVQKDGQKYNDGDAAYQLFTAGGDEFLIFGLGYAVRGPVERKWITDTMHAHPDAIVLYVMHYGLQEDNRYSGQARELFLDIVKDEPQARLLLCGHNAGSFVHLDRVDDDCDGTEERSYYTLMFNTQDDTENGLGFLRILTFDPADRSIRVSTYSPWYDSWTYSGFTDEENSFVLEDAF